MLKTELSDRIPCNTCETTECGGREVCEKYNEESGVVLCATCNARTVLREGTSCNDCVEKGDKILSSVVGGQPFPEAQLTPEEYRAAIGGHMVNSPPHYNQGAIQYIDAIKSAITNSGMSNFEAFCTGNALKYVWRWKLKGGHEDLLKAKWYIDRMLTPSEEDEADYAEKVNRRVDSIHEQLVAMGVKTTTESAKNYFRSSGIDTQEDEAQEETNNALTHILVCKICFLPADVYMKGKIGCDRCDRKEYVARRRYVHHILHPKTGRNYPIEWWNASGTTLALKTYHINDIIAALNKDDKSGFVIGRADDGGRRNGIKWRCIV